MGLAVIDREGERVHNLKIDDCASEQSSAFLAQLIRLRLYHTSDKPEDLLTISSDNMTALNLMDKFNCSPPSVNLTTRELTLDFGDSTHRPALRMHIPGMQTE